MKIRILMISYGDENMTKDTLIMFVTDQCGLICLVHKYYEIYSC